MNDDQTPTVVRRRGYIYQRGKTWWIQYAVGGKVTRVSLNTSDRDTAEQRRREILDPIYTAQAWDAADLLRRQAEKLESDASKHTAETLTLAAAWERFRNSPYRRPCGARQLESLEQFWRTFATWAAQRGVTHFAEVDDAIAAGFLSDDYIRSLTANTYNKYLSNLNRIFRIVGAEIGVERNPFRMANTASPVGLQRQRQVSRPHRPLTPDEIQRLLAVATGEMRTLFLVGIHTGMRLGDAATLAASSVDMTRGLIGIVPRKTSVTARGKLAVLPLFAPLRAELAAIQPSERGYFMPECASLYTSDTFSLSKRVSQVFDAAKVEATDAGTVGFHSLRHTFVALCFEAGIPLSVVQGWVGHTDELMTAHYAHLSPDRIAAYANKIGLPEKATAPSSLSA